MSVAVWVPSHVFLVLQVMDLSPLHNCLLAQRLQREQSPSHHPFLFPDHCYVPEAPLPQEFLCWCADHGEG